VAEQDKKGKSDQSGKGGGRKDKKPAKERYRGEHRWVHHKVDKFVRFLKKHPNWKPEDQRPGLNKEFLENLARAGVRIIIPEQVKHRK